MSFSVGELPGAALRYVPAALFLRQKLMLLRQFKGGSQRMRTRMAAIEAIQGSHTYCTKH